MPNSTIIRDTVVLLGLRSALFYLCRRFLLQHLYSDLRHLSERSTPFPSRIEPPTANESPSVQRPFLPRRQSSESEIELLPPPVSAPSLHSNAGSFAHAPILQAASTHVSHQSLSRTVFALTFAECCLLFLLVILQSADVLDEQGRLWNWRLSLLISSSLILLVSPLLQAHLVTSQNKRTVSIPIRIVSVVLPYGLYLLLLLRIPLPSQLSSAGFIESWMSRLIVVGVLMLGILSGFGAVTSAGAFFAAFNKSNWVGLRTEDIDRMEQSLIRVRGDLIDRKRELDRRKPPDEEQRVPWMSRLLGRNPGAREESALRQEIAGLEMLDDQMSRSLESMKARKARLEFSKTFGGRIWNAISYAFGIYCFFRIFSVLGNILRPFVVRRTSTGEPVVWNVPDVITYCLAYAVSHLPWVTPDSVDVQVLGRQISLLLVGAIVLSNVGLILRSVARALKVTSKNTGASLMLLILTQIMGMYLLSTLVQLRSSLPASSGSLYALLPRFELFGSLFDWSFFLTCAACAIWRWLAAKITGTDDWVQVSD